MRKNVHIRICNSLILIGFVILFSGCNPTVVELTEVEGTSLLSLKAQNKQLSQVLELINTETGIDIFIPEFKDKVVNVDIKQKPIGEALTLLIGPDVPYHISTTKDILTLLPKTEDKKGRRTETNPKIKKQKPEKYDSLEVISTGHNMKHPAESTELIVSNGSNNTKEKPEKSLKIETKPVKEAKKQIDTTQTFHKSLQFILEDGKIKLLDAVEVPGEYTELPLVVENFIYTLKEDDKILLVGSFADPTILHSFSKDEKEPHKVLKTKSGYFSISLPAAYSKSAMLKELSIDFYLPEDHLDPASLSPSLFNRSKNKLKMIQELKLSNYEEVINK